MQVTMKCIIIFILLCIPISCFGQSIQDMERNPKYLYAMEQLIREVPKVQPSHLALQYNSDINYNPQLKQYLQHFVKNEILIYLDISQIEAIIQRKQPLYKKLLGKINLFYIQNFSSKGVQL